MNCRQEKTEFRKVSYLKFTGTPKEEKRYNKALQCLDCGARLPGKNNGVWWPSEAGEDITKLPDFDNAIFEKAREEETERKVRAWREERERQAAERESQIKAAQELWVIEHAQYEEYIRTSREWQKRRELVLLRCNNTCEACLTAKATQVHHANYKSLYQELLFDLRGVCRDCHAKIHGLLRTDQDISRHCEDWGQSDANT